MSEENIIIGNVGNGVSINNFHVDALKNRLYLSVRTSGVYIYDISKDSVKSPKIIQKIEATGLSNHLCTFEKFLIYMSDNYLSVFKTVLANTHHNILNIYNLDQCFSIKD